MAGQSFAAIAALTSCSAARTVSCAFRPIRVPPIEVNFVRFSMANADILSSFLLRMASIRHWKCGEISHMDFTRYRRLVAPRVGADLKPQSWFWRALRPIVLRMTAAAGSRWGWRNARAVSERMRRYWQAETHDGARTAGDFTGPLIRWHF